MAKSNEDKKFYVVGGPVQPNRDCYIRRKADEELLLRLRRAEYCQILASRHTGKTSLIGATAAELRSRGVQVAVVDLGQLGGREAGDDPARWYYSIAHRITRDLRIKDQLQTWWQDQAGLTNVERLREFFLDIVLADPEAEVVVFFDRVEATVELPFGQEFFAAIRACFDSRASEGDYERLSMALAGTLTPAELVSDARSSPFEIARPINLPDFSREQMGTLLEGLPDMPQRDSVLRAVWSWTRGHPYLTQKLLRGLARRADSDPTPDDVDELVGNLFLNATMLREEPHLTDVAERLSRDNPRKIPRLSLYGRLCKGGEVEADLSNDLHRELLNAGAVTVDGNGLLAVRNRIYAQAFSARWVNQTLPIGWKGPLIAAAVALCLVGLPVWYSEYLPRPYVNTLNTVNQDYTLAQDAYEKLRFYPGFADDADELMRGFLVRQSLRAETLAELNEAHSRLIQVPGGQDQVDSLLARFWDRQAERYQHAGDRDAALLYRLKALTVANTQRRVAAAELVAADYPNLLGTLRSPDVLASVHADTGRQQLIIRDAAQTLQVWQLNEGQAQLLKQLPLAAEERLSIQQQRVLETSGRSKRLDLVLRTDHPQPVQLDILLRAPSGREVRLRGRDALLVKNSPELRFESSRIRELQELLAGDLAGTWTASFADSQGGLSGRLIDWELNVDRGETLRPEGIVEEPVLIPEPRIIAQAESRLNNSGGFALTWPEEPSVRGDVLVWDLSREQVISRLPRGTDLQGAEFILGGRAVLLFGPRSLEFFESISGERLGAIELTVAQSVRPRITGSGRYLVTESIGERGGNRLTVWSLGDLEPVRNLVTGSVSGAVAVDGDGRFMAAAGGDTLVRLYSLDEGTLQFELAHAAVPDEVIFDPTGRWLLTTDEQNTLRLWSLGEEARLVLERRANAQWQTAFADDGSSVVFGSADNPYQVLSLPSLEPVGVALRHSRAAGMLPGASSPVFIGPRLVVTSNGEDELKLWQLPVQTTLPAVTPARDDWNTAVAMDTIGQRIALGTRAGDVRILSNDPTAGVLVDLSQGPRFIGHTDEVSALAFSADGLWVASGAFDGSVRVWNVLNGSPRAFMTRQPSGAVQQIRFLDDGSALIVVTRGRLAVLDPVNGRLIAETLVQSLRPLITEVKGSILVAGPTDGLLRWDWQADQLEQLVPAGPAVTAMAVASTGELAALADEDGQLQVVGLTDGVVRQTGQLAGVADSVWFADEDRRLIAHAGSWLQRLDISDSELTATDTRLLQEAPSLVLAGEDARSALVLLRADSARPEIRTLGLSRADVEPLVGEAPAIQDEWQPRLSLDIGLDGLPVPAQTR